MAEGGGKITCGTPKPRTTPSQRKSIVAPKITGTARLHSVRKGPRSGVASRVALTIRQAPSRTAIIAAMKAKEARPPAWDKGEASDPAAARTLPPAVSKKRKRDRRRRSAAIALA